MLHNLMFVLSLVIVFVLAYFGTTSQQSEQFICRHTATVKPATAGFCSCSWLPGLAMSLP
jgi:hypothetical protein